MATTDTAEHVIDWSGDTDTDLIECLTDYTAGAEAAPGTPNGEALAAYARQITAELARRGLNAVRVTK